MKTRRAATRGKVEKLTKLGDLKPGSSKVFRFQGTSFEEALTGKDDNCFYMVIKTTPEKAGRVTVCSLDGAIVKECDVSHLVIAHDATVDVEDAEE